MDVYLACNDEFFIDVAQNLLEENHELTLFRSVDELMEQLQRAIPIALILDLELPGLANPEQSRELTDLIHQDYIPVMLVSDGVRGLDALDSVAVGFQADEMIFKNADPAKLVQKLASLIARTVGSETDYDVQRQHPRTPIDVYITVKSAFGILYHPAINISIGGVFLALDVYLPEQSLVTLRFNVPGQEGVVTVDGRVVWVAPADQPGLWSTGIRFTDASQTDLDKIKSYTNSVLKVMRGPDLPVEL